MAWNASSRGCGEIMKNATKRTILRWIHLVFTIPILGYIYSPASEVEQYAGGVRYIFVPVLLVSGYWMYAGVAFAVMGVAAWLGAYHFSGFGAALLSQVVLLIGRRVWLMMRGLRSKRVLVSEDQAMAEQRQPS